MKKTKGMNRRIFFKAIFITALAPTIQAGQKHSIQYTQTGNQFVLNSGSQILVLIYSYTGNTKIMADMIAARYQADLVEIRAEEYSDSFFGRNKASNDAWNEVKDTVIFPETIDMSKYQYIFLGSPIWWYRPAVPLWTAIEKNQFQGQEIILFNTFNSRFKDSYIDEFSSLIKAHGGKMTDHVYVRRGRWYDQLDQNELVEQIQKQLQIKEKMWGFGVQPSA